MQSHRVPKRVHDIAMNIVSRISHRLPKKWKPRTVEGLLTRHPDFENIDMSQGEWLVLARTRYMLNELEDTLYQKGLFYKNKFKRSYEQDLYDAIINWEQWRKGTLMNPDQITQMYSYISPQHADRNQLLLMNKDAHYSLSDCKNKFGLSTDSVWYESLDDAPWRKVEYIRKMRSNGEQLNKTPRILLSTIHGVKGGEAQNVVLLTDLSRNTQKGYERYPDDENRLFYVGATRTKEHLHIIEPKDVFKSYPI